MILRNEQIERIQKDSEVKKLFNSDKLSIHDLSLIIKLFLDIINDSIEN